MGYVKRRVTDVGKDGQTTGWQEARLCLPAAAAERTPGAAFSGRQKENNTLFQGTAMYVANEWGKGALTRDREG